MKKNLGIIILAVSTLFAASCKKDMSGDEMMSESGRNANLRAGAVYTLSNNVANNQVLIYMRAADGSLTYHSAEDAGGTGTGGGLGNQGALALAGNLLFAVNAGSNTISSFRVSQMGLELISTVPSGGTQPVSLTVWEDLLYVLNSGGTGNISGFDISANGMLMPLANSTRPLSSMDAGGAQVSFVNYGTALVVTEKNTNMIISYTVAADGTPDDFNSLMSANQTPFGFAVGNDGMIYVSEAAGGAPGASSVSSYHVAMNGMITLVDGPVMAGQSAACWVAINNSNRYVYATNTASNNISSFTTRGSLEVLEAIAGNGNMPIDAAFNNSSKYLYVLNSGDETIGVFEVMRDGSLMHIQMVSGLPDGATGLVSK